MRKIQLALVQLDGAKLALDGIYGPKTAAAVAAYKRRRNILNTQGRIDDIVGKKTTAALDREMLEREKALEKAPSLLLLGFGISPPPVPFATKFRIRTLKVGLKSSPPNQIYAIIDSEHGLGSFYFIGDLRELNVLRFAFLQQKVLDRGAFTNFTTRLPIQVTGFQPEPVFETTTKKAGEPGRERVELSFPIFQKDGLTLNMDGLFFDNPSGTTIKRSGIMFLIEKEPHKVP